MTSSGGISSHAGRQRWNGVCVLNGGTRQRAPERSRKKQFETDPGLQAVSMELVSMSATWVTRERVTADLQ